MYRLLRCLVCLLVLIPTIAQSHGGRTDSNGGHYNRKTGEYHFHNGGQAAPPRTTHIDSKQTPHSQTVYITRTGHKYHRDGCRHLKSRIPISLQAAKQQYAPCKVCMPPV